MSDAVRLLTQVHTAISLVGIASGAVWLWGVLRGLALPRWTGVFLVFTILTSVTGYFFPFHRLMPSHVVGAISLVVLAVVLWARYGQPLMGGWGRVFVVGGVAALYFNVFVLVAQLFDKVPALHELAPTQSEPPFGVAQLVVLVIFVGLGIAAFRRTPSAAARPAV